MSAGDQSTSDRGVRESIFIGIGSNLGDRIANLVTAVNAMDRVPGVLVFQVSPAYETAPIGGPEQGAFLNAVVHCQTSLEPRELLAALMRIEAAMGRVRNICQGCEPRVIDLDLLLHGNFVGDSIGQDQTASGALHVPHPRLHLRRFVLQPLAGVAADRVHPALGVRIDLLLSNPAIQIQDGAWDSPVAIPWCRNRRKQHA